MSTLGWPLHGQVFWLDDGRLFAVGPWRCHPLIGHFLTEELVEGGAVLFPVCAGAKFPCQHLGKHQRVNGRPRFDFDINAGQFQRTVFQSEVAGVTIHYVSVDAIGKGLQVGHSLAVIATCLLLRHTPPAKSADEDVCSEQVIVFAGQFLDCAAPSVPEELHLPPAILRLRVALSKQQVMHVAGVDVRDTPLIAQDFHSVIQPGDCDFPLMLWQWPPGHIVEEEVSTDKNKYDGNHKGYYDNSNDFLTANPLHYQSPVS